ncbi:hypothetical protein [Dawidia soli]|uniref:Sugar transporter n=1 Tax=Dawidia soli TaxID=2782352 RepID=A0AAP2GJM2_9BACT|nr:hypothetical protein [Dawidia soli]MBT1688640.1 hypothetical protein [Dawidia soli]
MTTSPKPAAWFWIVSILALLWNLMGIMAYIMRVTMTPEALQALPEQERALYTNVPVWATAAFAVAVWGSTLACVLLLIRKKLAMPVFVISFIAILIQMVHSLFISNSIAVYGPGGMIMPVMILVIGLYMILFSRQATSKGWLR